jgi:transposase
MERMLERCCGLDVHQASVVACLLVDEGRRKPRREVRTFGTMTKELEELAAWLQAEGCTHVVMESTGVYWMPVYAVLEGKFELVVGNAQHIKQVPGRKTDVSDSQWLAHLLRCGLIRPSYIPPKPLRELRDLLRYRRKLVGARSTERNRLQKLLETANIKLASVMSDVFGVSGKAMLQAILENQLTNEEIAALARGTLRQKQVALQDALDGRFEEHHRFLLQTQLERMDELDAHISTMEQRVDEKLTPYGEQHTRLMQIPGVSRIVAATIIAELGIDMSIFRSAEECAAWVGVCPGNHQSAGTRKRVKSRQGNEHLTTALVEAAQAAARTKGTYLRDKFYRLKARIGYGKAVMAIAHKILIAVYHMLKTGVDYRELGETYLDERDQKRLTQRLVHRLKRLGYQVTLQPRDEVASSEDAPGPPQEVPANSAACAAPTPSPPSAVRPPEHRPAQPRRTAPKPRAPHDHARRQVTTHRDPRIPPVGHVLRRTHQGVEHHVHIRVGGFEYQGQFYASLSRVAKVITGTAWNGFRFFGLDTPSPVL